MRASAVDRRSCYRIGRFAGVLPGAPETPAFARIRTPVSSGATLCVGRTEPRAAVSVCVALNLTSPKPLRNRRSEVRIPSGALRDAARVLANLPSRVSRHCDDSTSAVAASPTGLGRGRGRVRRRDSSGGGFWQHPDHTDGCARFHPRRQPAAKRPPWERALPRRARFASGTAEIQHGALRCGHPGKARGIAVAAESAPLSIPYLHGTKLAGEDFVASLVIVMPNDAQAKAEIAALGSRHGRACLAHGLSTESASPYAITVRFVPVERLLGREAVAVHVVQRRRVPPRARRPLPPLPAILYSSEAIFRIGAADVLFFAASDRRQLPAVTELRLLSLLHKRAAAHRL